MPPASRQSGPGNIITSQLPPRRRGLTPLTPMRRQAAKSMRKLAQQVQQSHPDMAVHDHVRDAARMLESGNEEAAQRHLRAAAFALTPQSLHRQGVHDDGGHIAARQAVHGLHRHMLLVRDITDAGEKNLRVIGRASYGDAASSPPVPSYGGDPGALAQKPVARQPGGDRALNAPARTNSGGSDANVADPDGPQPKGSKQFSYGWGDLAAVIGVIELTGDAQHHHIPGSPMDYRHGYIPLTEAGARSHFHGKVPKGWSAPSGGGKGKAAAKAPGATARKAPAKAATSYDVDKLVKDIKGRTYQGKPIMARYRASAAVSAVTGIDSGATGKYGPMVSLYNDLSHGRLDPADTAKFHAENFSAKAVSGQADRAEAVAQVLDRLDHSDEDVKQWMPEHPAEVAKAAKGLHEYARAAREALAKGVSPEPEAKPSKPFTPGPSATGERAVLDEKGETVGTVPKTEAARAAIRADVEARKAYREKGQHAYALHPEKLDALMAARDSAQADYDRAIAAYHAEPSQRNRVAMQQARSKSNATYQRYERTAAIELRKAQADNARRITEADKSGLPGLVRVGGSNPDGSFTAVDGKGTEHKISLKDGTVTVSREGKTASAPAGSDPTTVARELADQLAKGYTVTDDGGGVTVRTPAGHMLRDQTTEAGFSPHQAGRKLNTRIERALASAPGRSPENARALAEAKAAQRSGRTTQAQRDLLAQENDRVAMDLNTMHDDTGAPFVSTQFMDRNKGGTVQTARSWDDLAAAIIDLSAETAALERTPAPIGKPGGPGLYHVKGLGHAPYFEQVRNGLMKRGVPAARAHQMTWGILRRWAKGGGDVHPEVRAAAVKALAEEDAARARAHAHASSWDQVLRQIDLAAAARGWDGVALELASVIELYNPSQPRVPAGQAGGGQFAPGATSTAPSNARPVGMGATGQQVSDLQKRLNALGAKPPLQVDGKFGPRTLAAVKAYQKAHGLKADGLVGPKTTAALRLKTQAAKKPKAAKKTAAA